MKQKINRFLTEFIENDAYSESEQNFEYWIERFFTHMENYDKSEQNEFVINIAVKMAFYDVLETEISRFFELLKLNVTENVQEMIQLMLKNDENLHEFNNATDKIVRAWIVENRPLLLEKLAFHASKVIELPLQIRDNLFKIADLVTVLEQSPTVHLASMFGTEGYLEECYVEDWGFDELDLILDVVNQDIIDDYGCEKNIAETEDFRNIFFNKQQFIDLLKNSGKTLVFFSYDDETGNCPMILF